MYLCMFYIPTVVQRMWWIPMVQWNEVVECVCVLESSSVASSVGGIGESSSLLQIQCSNPFPFQHEILYEWINEVYLDLDSQAQIQEEFEERSEILLKDFLKVSPVVHCDVICQSWSGGWQVPHGMKAGKGLASTSIKTKHLLSFTPKGEWTRWPPEALSNLNHSDSVEWSPLTACTLLHRDSAEIRHLSSTLFSWELNVNIFASLPPRKRNTSYYVKHWRTKRSSGVVGGQPTKGGEWQHTAPGDQAE